MTTEQLVWEQPRERTYIAKSGNYSLEIIGVGTSPIRPVANLRVLDSQGRTLRKRTSECRNLDAAKEEVQHMLADHRKRVEEKRERDWAKRLAPPSGE